MAEALYFFIPLMTADERLLLRGSDLGSAFFNRLITLNLRLTRTMGP